MKSRILEWLQALIDRFSEDEYEHYDTAFVIEIGEQFLAADWYEEIPTSEGSTMGIVFGTEEHGIKAMHLPYMIHFKPDFERKMPESKPPEGYI